MSKGQALYIAAPLSFSTGTTLGLAVPEICERCIGHGVTLVMLWVFYSRMEPSPHVYSVTLSEQHMTQNYMHTYGLSMTINVCMYVCISVYYNG